MGSSNTSNKNSNVSKSVFKYKSNISEIINNKYNIQKKASNGKIKFIYF